MVEVKEQPDLATEAKGQITNPELPAADQSGGAEKWAIVQRLKDYRAAHGLGCLAKISQKTAHRKGSRISEDILREIAAGRAPKMQLLEWRKITMALDAIEKEKSDA